MKRTSSFLLVIATVLLSGCATDTHRRDERLRSALVTAADADSLAAAALLARESNASLSLLERASAAAPDQPNFAWLLLQQCNAIEACDPKPVEVRFRAIDPGNGAAWAGSVARAAKAGDAGAVQAYMLEIGQAERFDFYWNTNIVRLTDALVRTRKIGKSEAVTLVIGMLAATAIVGYKDISDACKGEALKRADVLMNCRRVATAMRNGDTYITEMMGVAVAKRVWPEDSAEYREALEEQRVAQYRMKTNSAGVTNNIKRYLALMASHRREQDVFLAQLVDDGFDPNPPADWAESKAR